MHKLYIVLIAAFMMGCESKTGKTYTGDSTLTSTNTTKPDKPVDAIVHDISGCYMQVLKRDTFAVILKKNGNDITGRLSFDNYEKDGSTGTVKGKMEGGILKLIYSFASEGTNSIMEVYFKYQDSTLIRGIGEMTTNGNSAYFKDPPSIKYNGSVLTKMNCDNLPEKYK